MIEICPGIRTWYEGDFGYRIVDMVPHLLDEIRTRLNVLSS